MSLWVIFTSTARSEAHPNDDILKKASYITLGIAVMKLSIQIQNIQSHFNFFSKLIIIVTYHAKAVF